MLMVTHDEHVAAIGTRRIILDRGQFVENPNSQIVTDVA
jgi:hypothetical protein